MENFKLTRPSADVDSLLEKFRIEISSAVNEDRTNGRKITITSTRNDPDHTSDIDSQIKELEDIIQKLQNEITDLGRNADEYVPKDYSDSEKSYMTEENKEKAEVSDNKVASREDKGGAGVSETEQYNQVFPLFLQDVILPLSADNTPISTVVSELITVNADSSSDREQIDTVKQEVLTLSNELKDNAPKDNLHELINQLQTEISEKLETLNDIDIDDLPTP
ncbi:unnamed protein product [Diatraea saccharalis]|uniref:Uncharacterized protein n=1 Tax=Diatraea saccharalis TaxID=40085 RepID=A0A9N9WKD4_9NEOP|nr:unnamed protein product [Diatraea saccharalis]